MAIKVAFLFLTAILTANSIASELKDQLVGAWTSSTTTQSEGKLLEIYVLSLYRSNGVYNGNTIIKLSGQCQFANLSGTWSMANRQLTTQINHSDFPSIPSGTSVTDTINQLNDSSLTITDEDGEQEHYKKIKSRKDANEFHKAKSECIQAYMLKSTPDMALLQPEVKFTHKPTGISIKPKTANWLLNQSAGNKMALVSSDGAFIDIIPSTQKTSDDDLKQILDKQIQEMVKAVKLKGLSISVGNPSFETLANAPYISLAHNCYTMTVDNLLPPVDMCLIRFQSVSKEGFLIGSGIVEHENISAIQSLIQSATLMP